MVWYCVFIPAYLILGWWSFTFPIGVFTLSTTLISRELPSLFFKVLATVWLSTFMYTVDIMLRITADLFTYGSATLDSGYCQNNSADYQ